MLDKLNFYEAHNILPIKGIPFDLKETAAVLAKKTPNQVRDYYYRSLKQTHTVLKLVENCVVFQFKEVRELRIAFLAFLRTQLKLVTVCETKNNKKRKLTVHHAWDIVDYIAPIWKKWGYPMEGREVTLKLGSLECTFWFFPSQPLSFGLQRFFFCERAELFLGVGPDRTVDTSGLMYVDHHPERNDFASLFNASPEGPIVLELTRGEV